MTFMQSALDRSDKVAMVAAAIFLLFLTLSMDPTLREFSTTLSLICLMGLLWRVIGSLPRMTPLSVTLAVALILTLASGALAQYLLSRQIASMPTKGPDNTTGILIVLTGRLFILYVVIRWTALLDKWDHHVAGKYL